MRHLCTRQHVVSIHPTCSLQVSVNWSAVFENLDLGLDCSFLPVMRIPFAQTSSTLKVHYLPPSRLVRNNFSGRFSRCFTIAGARSSDSSMYNHLATPWYVYMHICMCMHLYILMYIHKYIHIRVHMYMHIYIYICTH